MKTTLKPVRNLLQKAIVRSCNVIEETFVLETRGFEYCSRHKNNICTRQAWRFGRCLSVQHCLGGRKMFTFLFKRINPLHYFTSVMWWLLCTQVI